MKYTCGVDIVLNDRFKTYDIKKVKFILTENEYLEYLKKDVLYKPIFLAGRWAAKEAIFKAISKSSNKTISKNIEIINDNDGKPICTNINNVSVSISHEKKYTIAFAIYEHNN